MPNEAGRNFVIAKVFPSREVCVPCTYKAMVRMLNN